MPHRRHSLELLAHLDLSAASGLVCRDEQLFTVADDALELLCTDLQGVHATRLPLRDPPHVGALPKALKPDFEALLVCGDWLLAMGSGSGAARRSAVQLMRDQPLKVIDLGPLYDALALKLRELNIEGATVDGDNVWLAQRGNGAGGENALVRLDRARFERCVDEGAITPDCLVEILPVMPGDFGGVALSLTDLCVGPRGVLLFTAAAEATTSAWDDGAIAGSIVGTVSREGLVLERLAHIEAVKLEGVCWLESGELRLVADPDDPSAKAPLYRLREAALASR